MAKHAKKAAAKDEAARRDIAAHALTQLDFLNQALREGVGFDADEVDKDANFVATHVEQAILLRCKDLIGVACAYLIDDTGPEHTKELRAIVEGTATRQLREANHG